MRRRRKRMLAVALGLAAAGAGAVGIGACTPPASLRAVKEPRGGEAVGGRVAVVFSERYTIALPGADIVHPFDTRKYAKIYVHLNEAGLVRPATVFVPDEAGPDDLRLVHTERYLGTLDSPEAVARYLEARPVKVLPAKVVDAGILRAHRVATGGTILAGRLALAHGIAVNLGGGFHHAGPDAGEGFCVYNDLAIAIRRLQADGRVRRALVVDLDVHQGNGTAECFAGDDEVFTFSMHQGNIYPVPKATSDLDVELAAGTDDARFLAILRKHLPAAFDRARPDIVFYQAGCDTLHDDPLADLAMTQAGIVERDAAVVDAGVRRGVPVVVTLGGGYTPRSWSVQAASVANLIRTYGLQGGDPPHPPRKRSVHEKMYTK
jgi:histone deacetylase 11